MADLDTSLLRAFVTVADAGGFTRAAARLNRTQAAVSMQIRRLEAQLGVDLFEDRKRVTLSPHGETLIGYARRILAMTEEAAARLDQTDITGTVTLGTPDDYATSLLPSILARFARSHPNVTVNVRCEQSVDLIPEVDAGRVDLALITKMPNQPGGPPLCRESLVWVVGEDPSLLEADPLPLALFPQGCLFRDMLTDALSRQGRSWRVAYTSRSLAAMTAAVSAGLAVTVLTPGAVASGLNIVGEDERLPALPPIEITCYHGQGDVAPATRRLRDYIAQTIAGAPSVAAE